MNSLQGSLLVASPHLKDSPFSRSVVFLVRHDEQGAFGVVLNRPVRGAIRESLSPEVTGAADCDVQVKFGGPVMNSIVALEQQATNVAACTEPAACEAALRRAFQSTPSTPSRAVRIFIGHAGWQAGQLESELAQGVWMTTTATPAHVFGDDEQLWASTVREIGRSVLRESLGIARFPADPTMN
ncbi:MAG: YqgE/AlgH family protein [Planctomycetales bacterium]|nr:YqgE/AlgH family protein [Planctomycetales bacterium]MCA9207083.1 YqgE/AlgH family protein [Planctomycetales bacterium]